MEIMPPKLRPRWQLPPSDHNYAKTLTHLPVYGENSWPVILTGPQDIFQKVPIEPKLKSDDGGSENESVDAVHVKAPKKRNRSVSENARRDESEGGQPKRKRRKFFKGTTFEPKRRRKRKRSTSNTLAITQNPKESGSKTEHTLNDSGISTDLNESIKAELDQNTNSLKINPTEVMGLYCFSLVQMPTVLQDCTISQLLMYPIPVHFRILHTLRK